ncbi:MAG TPA: 6-phospho-3-hexuloisomerase [Planctomycetota bacterium]|nr:6-phospho-3-hexuloisomerase [Planctomycetota bacterium]
MDTGEHASIVLSELARVMAAVDARAAERLVEQIRGARRVYVAACGRSALAARAFAMRLMHLGCAAHVAGDTTTPAIGKGDLLIVCSGKGEKATLIGFMRAAAAAGAGCAAVTSEPGSSVARLAGTVIGLPVGGSVQFGGSLFEQAALVLFDSIVLRLIDATDARHEDMAARHANLE